MRTARSPRLVALVGGSGAGKSWLADRLQRALGSDAGRLSLDDFYYDRSHLPPKRRANVNFDHPRAIDWRSVERALEDCRSGRTIRLPRYEFVSHSRGPKPELWRPKPLILMEGLWLLRRPAVRRLFDLRIFVESPARLRFRRRLARDVAERGRSPAAVRRQFFQTVAPMHVRFVAPQARWADIRLRRPPDENEVRQLAARLRALLANYCHVHG